jgi:hypothetical protein
LGCCIRLPLLLVLHNQLNLTCVRSAVGITDGLDT